MIQLGINPCPRCGSGKAPTVARRFHGIAVECEAAKDGCGLTGEGGMTDEEAIDYWNTSSETVAEFHFQLAEGKD